MAASDEQGQAGREPDSLSGRLAASRHILAALALVLFALMVTGALGLAHALVAFAIVAAAALVGGEAARAPYRSLSVPERRAPRLADPLVEAVIAGLPDPVIVLDRAARVLAFNDRAVMIAPALSRGEPVSLALRMPEIVEAIRRAGAE